MNVQTGLNVFEGREKKEKFRKKKNREASTTGGCMLKTPKPI